MKKLQCTICGGNLVMDTYGEFAVCDSCGMQFKKETIQNMVTNNYNDIHDSVVNIYEQKKENVKDLFNKAKACFKAGLISDATKIYGKAEVSAACSGEKLDDGELEFYLVMYCYDSGNHPRDNAAKLYSEKYPAIQQWERDWITASDENWNQYWRTFFEDGLDPQWWDKQRCSYVCSMGKITSIVNTSGYLIYHWMLFNRLFTNKIDWISTDKIEFIFKNDPNKYFNPYVPLEVRTYEDRNTWVSIYELALYGGVILPLFIMDKELKTTCTNLMVAHLIEQYYPTQEQVRLKVCPSCKGRLGLLGKCKSCGRTWK